MGSGRLVLNRRVEYYIRLSYIKQHGEFRVVEASDQSNLECYFCPNVSLFRKQIVRPVASSFFMI
jgi:hypothetical protein